MRTQHRRGFLELVGALELLGADVEQRHLGALDVERSARIGGTHQRELDEVVGIALGVRTEIEHHDVIFAEAGQARGKRRAIDPRHGPERELGHRHQCAGVARRHSSGDVMILHRRDRHAH